MKHYKQVYRTYAPVYIPVNMFCVYGLYNYNKELDIPINEYAA